MERAGALGPIYSVYCRDPDGNLVEISSYRRVRTPGGCLMPDGPGNSLDGRGDLLIIADIGERGWNAADALLPDAFADFDFDLPPDRIAQHPARPRDAARLLHVGADGLGGPDGARPARAAAAGRCAGGERHAGVPGATPGAAGRRRGSASPSIGRDADGVWQALARNGAAAAGGR